MASTVWRGFITFGLISIPVRLFRAARAERVSLRRVYRAEAPVRESTGSFPRTGPDLDVTEAEEESDAVPQESPRRSSADGRRAPEPEAVHAPVLTPVQQVSVLKGSDRKGSDQIVPEKSVVKGYEYEKGRYVAIEPEELKSIAPKTGTEMGIEEFVNLAEVDPVYFETSYYVVPEEAGRKAYALLYRSLQISGLVAVARLAMHSREHVVIVRPGSKGLLVHTMFFSSEVRADEEYGADTRLVNQKELDLAQTLIHSLAAPFEPQKYHDTYREKLEEMIARRVAGQPAAAPERIARPAPVVDITEALQRSLAALKKPAASEEQPRKTAKSAPTPRKKMSRSAG